MKLEIKKIVARELLLLIVVGLCAIVSFGGIYFYNLVVQRQTDNLDASVNKRRTQLLNLSFSYDLKKLIKIGILKKHQRIGSYQIRDIVAKKNCGADYRFWQKLTASNTNGVP